jgi:ParB-like chromosome segregation protein Spo0J
MTETLEHEQQQTEDPRVRGVQIEAKLVDWNIAYRYNPKLPIGNVRVVESAQTRSTEHIVDRAQVERYAAQMDNGAVFPPIVLMGDTLLLDGNTRLAAARKLRRKTIPVFHAEFPNAELGRSFAAALNQQNGRSLTTEEAQAAAISLLAFGHTEESVAREIGYSRTAIAHWRKEKEYHERAATTLVVDQAASVAKTEQRKLADIKLNTPFAAAVNLVADVRPKAKDVTDLVAAIKEAPSEADALDVIARTRKEWAPAGPPPHRVSVPAELQSARRALPQLVALANNPLLLVEQDQERRDRSLAQWRAVRDLADQVLTLS